MWKIIRIDFNSPKELLTNAFRIVMHFEAEYDLQKLYFAQYNDGERPYLQISAESSSLDYESVEYVAKQYKCVTKWAITYRVPDEFCDAFALAYSMCKKVLHLDQPDKEEKLYQLFHWTQNMLGFNYSEEANNYIKWFERTPKNLNG